MRTLSIILPLLVGCSGTGKDSDTGDSATSAAAIQEIASAAQWADNATVSVGDHLVFESDGLPDHATQEHYDGLGDLTGDCSWDAQGTSEIQDYELYFEISLSPALASVHTDTNLGGIGPAISGASFFNPWEATETCYANEVAVDGPYGFIDDCGGHPTPNETGSMYHYHGVPSCTVASVDVDGEHSRVIGFLADGFPMYGPLGEGGEAPDDLDDCLGHYGAVPETDEPVYHYHVSYEPPYIAPCFAGTPQLSGG